MSSGEQDSIKDRLRKYQGVLEKVAPVDTVNDRGKSDMSREDFRPQK